MWWPMFLIPAPARQKEAFLCVFETSLVNRAMQKEAISNNRTKPNQKNKQTKTGSEGFIFSITKIFLSTSSFTNLTPNPL